MATDKYYRSLLEPTYLKLKEELKNRVSEHNPDSLAASLDGWTAIHHGYIGIILYYMHEWKRFSFHLYCQPCDDSHTGEKIRGIMEEHLQE